MKLTLKLRLMMMMAILKDAHLVKKKLYLPQVIIRKCNRSSMKTRKVHGDWLMMKRDRRRKREKM